MMWDRAPTAAVQHIFLGMGVTPKETESSKLCLRLQACEKLLWVVGLVKVSSSIWNF